MSTLINPGFTATQGRKPHTKEKLIVQFRSFTDWQHPYTVEQILCWEERNNGTYAFDVIAVKRA